MGRKKAVVPANADPTGGLDIMAAIKASQAAVKTQAVKTIAEQTSDLRAEQTVAAAAEAKAKLAAAAAMAALATGVNAAAVATNAADANAAVIAADTNTTVVAANAAAMADVVQAEPEPAVAAAAATTAGIGVAGTEAVASATAAAATVASAETAAVKTEPAAVKKEEGPLPEGWLSTIDQASGDVYYYHAGRQISQWERPTEEDNAPLKKSTGNLDEWGFGDGDSTALGSLGLDDEDNPSRSGSGTATPNLGSAPSASALENIGLDWVGPIKEATPLTPVAKTPGAGTPTFQLVRGKNGSLTTAMVAGGTAQAASAAFAGGDEWDQAAPMGVNVKKQKGVKKPQTIIEEIIAAASRTAGDASYNSVATVTDDRASELLGPIERYLNENFFPMKYQLAWLDFFLSQTHKGGIFADDMGLGKTYSVWLAVMHDNPPRRGDRKTLLVANNHAVLTQWRGELTKFFQNVPSWYTHAWIGEERWSDESAQKFADAQVILTTKDIVVMDFQVNSPYWITEHSKNGEGTSVVMYSPKDGEPKRNSKNPKEDNALIKRRKEAERRGRRSRLFSTKPGQGVFDLVFVDEGDMIRAETEHMTPGQVRKRSWQAHWHLHCDRTWIMTGTPVNNNATGLLSLFELGRCGASLPKKVQGLWTRDGSRPLAFMEQVKRLNWIQQNAAQVQAVRILQKTNFLRRTIDMKEIQLQNADYGRPLPKCRYVDCPVTVGRGEDVYFHTVETNTSEALGTWLKMASHQRYESWNRVWQGMTRARQVAAINPRIGLHPAGTLDVTDFNEYPLSEKEKVILGICQAATRADEQVVIATLFVDANVRLVSLLKRHRITAERFDGKLNQKLRQKGMDDFQAGRSSVMVMLMFAGGRGLNLQNANHLILTSPWWNPVVLDQTRRRVWRVGSPHKVVTMYNVFYDISVEQWMLQTRIKSKMMLAASLMNEEGIYGGEEAITTARSKKELSQTLQTQKLDEMWDFLSFLRAAPTARTEIRGVENVVWTDEMMSHPLIGPRCRQMMVTLFVCTKRTTKNRRLPKLPLEIWKRVFNLFYGQDFAPVPQQIIESTLEPEDQVALVRQQNLQKLQDIAEKLEECKQFLTALHFKKQDAVTPELPEGTLEPGDLAMVTELLSKQQQLHQVRQLLDDPLSSGLTSRAANTSVLWLDTSPGMPQHGETATHFANRVAVQMTRPQQTAYTALQYLEYQALQQANFAKGDHDDLERPREIAYMDDDQMLDDDDDAEPLEGEAAYMSDEDEIDKLMTAGDDIDVAAAEDATPLDPAVMAQLQDGMIKYLNRKPSTREQLVKKLKPILKLAEEAGQARQADAFMSAVLQGNCISRLVGHEAHWEIRKDADTLLSLADTARASPVAAKQAPLVAAAATSTAAASGSLLDFGFDDDFGI